MENEKSLEKRIYASWLYAVPGIGNRTIDKLLDLCGDEKTVYQEGISAWKQVLTARQLEQIKDFAGKWEPEMIYGGLLEKQIRFVMREDEEYPLRLKHIPDPPYALYVKGRLPCNEEPSVAVVGARDCSEYGGFVAAAVGEALGAGRVQVISGMARGIDGISQRAALQAGGSSFGVLGCGVDVCYPASNRELYERLCEKGGVLSAYPPGTEARPGNFPPRNRIVSGLSDILIVVEARAKSGTLITVDMALEQGKDVYVVPGRITDRLSDGCNRLLKQGAEVLLSPKEFIEEVSKRWSLGPTGEMPGSPNNLLKWRCMGKEDSLGPDYRAVYELIGFDAVSIGQLQAKLSGQYTVSKLMGILMGLCTQGLVVQISPGHFMRKTD